jgi:hypothetical protein
LLAGLKKTPVTLANPPEFFNKPAMQAISRISLP